MAQLEGQSAAANAEASMKYVDYHYEASEFEKKLIQVPAYLTKQKNLSVLEVITVGIRIPTYSGIQMT